MTCPNDDLQAIDLQVEALFISDTHGRLRYIREPGYTEAVLDAAPRFFMGRTLAGNIWRFRFDLSDGLIQIIEQECRSEPVALSLTDLTDPPKNAAAIRAALHASAPIIHEERGPAYWIPDSVSTSAEVVLISEANAHLLAANFPCELPLRSGSKIGPLVATVVQNNAISICYCARITSLAAEAGVETVETMRGRGYASAAVAGWAHAVRQWGLVPLYSTSWGNAASQGIAHKLGMVHYGDDWSIT
ncbi:MAG: GNAT family N-acetyltransferase [Chloroflexales bacterium]|nr:GNAT family N-acetyltransferase [Chloroflexales bacterium]